MALTKVTKHIIHGSLLVQFKYSDLSDTTLSSNTQSWTRVGNAITITPQYADSILEASFSGSFYDSDGGDDVQDDLALYVNGVQEYLQGQLFGGPTGGNNWSQHGGNHDRVQHGIIHAHFHDFRKSVGFVHAFQPGTTNAQVCEIKFRCADNNSRTVNVSEGFFILKEISLGIATLSGSR